MSANPERPVEAVERAACAVFASVLGRARIGPGDHFFRCGGHSLLAARVAAQLGEELGVELPVSAVFAAPTPAELARVAASAPPRRREALAAVDSPRPTPSQRRLWFVTQVDPASTAAYNVPVALRLTGSLDVPALERAFRDVVTRHEALRSRLVLAGGELTLAEAVLPELAVEDLAESPAALAGRASAEARADLDLATGPLRARLFRLADDEHVLLVTVHHAVFDGWSEQLLTGDLLRTYAGRPSEPAPPFAAYAAVLASRSEDAVEADVRWWLERLDSAPTVLALGAPGALPSYRGARIERTLDAAAVGAIAREEDATPFAVLLAAFGSALAVRAGVDDVLVAAPVAARPPGFERTVGFFANTLPLRVDLRGGPTFREVVRRVRNVVVGALDRQEVPFERLVDALVPLRVPGRRPLVQAALAFQSVPREQADAPGLRVRREDVHNGTAKFDVTLEVDEDGSGLRARLEYDAAILCEADARGLLDGVERAIASAPAPRGRCLHERFAEQAAVRPGAVAATCGDDRLTYAELDRAANRLAHRLRELGVGRDTLVGLCAERSLDLVVAILGILKAGGAYLPLDPVYPDERLAFMLDDADVRVVVTQESLRGRLPDDRAVVSLDGERAALAATAATAPATVSELGDLAYVIYTSGSTGVPKGVMVEHRNVTRLFDATDPEYGFDESDVWTLFHSYAFDFSVWELWGALLYGGRLVVVPSEAARSPHALLELVRQEGVTVLNQTPSAFRGLVRADAEDGDRSDLPLRWVIFGGEALDLEVLRPWFERHGDTQPRLVNMYGITETTVHVTFRPLTSADVDVGGSPIGRPIADLELRLLDRDGKPVGTDEVGELYVGGAGVARGYLNRPELNAERFVADPLAPGARLYRSGDLARLAEDGELHFVGRADAQVKIRGFRIELGEIESALRACADVGDAVVVARDNGHGERRLVAYVVPDARRPPVDALRATLARSLPDYMIPAAIVYLPEVPLTENGKLDVRMLPPPGATRPDLEVPFRPPGSRAERVLAAVWADVLRLEEVGVDDNFFSLGGDSILSIQAVAKARESGLELSLADVFERQTIAELAAATVAGSPAAAPATDRLALLAPEDRERLPEGIDDAYPATALQLGMLFHSEYSDESTMYHNVSMLRIPRALDGIAFRRCVAELCDRHEVLRTSFALTGFAEPVQLVHAGIVAPVDEHDLRGLDPAEQARIVDEWFEREKRHRFDRRHAPLLRFWAAALDDESFQLGYSHHHAILDGWSAATMLTELLALYLGGDARRPALRARYRDFVRLEREALAAETSQRYWSSRLDGAPLAELPRVPALQPPCPEAVAVRRLELRPGDLERLRRLSLAVATPLKSLLLAAHLRVIAALTGTRDIVTGLVTNGRPEGADGDRVLGLYLNTAPLRVELPNGSWFDLVRAAFAAERELMPHRRFPLAEVQRLAGRAPLFEVAFNYVHFRVYTDLSEVGDLELVDAPSFEESNFPLMVNAVVDPFDGSVALELEYDTRTFSAEQMEQTAEHYRRAVRELARRPEMPWDGPPATAAERRRIARWNDTATPFPDVPLSALVASGGAGGIWSDGVEWPLDEVSRRANGIAWSLAELGVGRGDVVGVCAERSHELPVALLGVLRAGAAFLPLEPEYPAERLAYMLQTAGAGTVLAQSRLADRVVADGVRVLPLEELVERQAEEPPPVRATADDLAYVLFTSGSTGRPKGAGNTNAGIVNRLAWMQAAFGLEPGEAVLQKTPIGFDVSVWELFWPYVADAQMVLAPPGLHRDPRALARLIGEQRVTTCHFVPSMLELFLEQADPDDLHSLKRVICSGEALPYPLQERFFERLPWSELHNLYGPTEAAIDVTWHRCGLGGLLGVVPIGRPIANCTCHVLDERGRPVPPGSTGELYLGGVQLAAGYVNRPDLTAERFVDVRGERLYRTGDRARWLPSGEVDFLGRLDNQVKLRGVRIELGEVEAALQALPGVRAAACRVVGVGADARLAAYVVGDEDLTGDDLREQLRRHLPDAMVPSVVTQIPELPLSPNGKLDRSRLPDPEPAAHARHRSPRTPTEQLVCAIFEAVLDRRPIGLDDDFFELGGHSLRAFQAVARTCEAFSISLPVHVLFQAPKAAAFAEAVERAQRRAGDADLPLSPVLRDGPLPVSLAQERLFAIQEARPERPPRLLHVAVRARGPFDADAFARALGRLVDRHEALRTRFLRVDGVVVQVPCDDARVELARLAAPSFEVAVALAAAEAARRFDWTRDVLLRATAIRVADDDHVLVLVVDHFVSDGWSISVLLRDLEHLYAEETGGAPAQLPELALQAADYAVWQRRRLASPGPLLDYWESRLDPVTPLQELSLPADAVDGRDRHRRLVRPLEPSVVERARRYARAKDATFFMLALAVADAAIARQTGEESIAVMAPFANRSSATADIVGRLAHALILRVDLDGEPCLDELLGRARRTVLDGFAHGDVPMAVVLRRLGADRYTGAPSGVSVFFDLDEDLPVPSLRGLELELLDLADDAEHAGVHYENLLLSAVESPGGLRLEARFDAGRASEVAVAAILDDWASLLDEWVAAPARPLSTIAGLRVTRPLEPVG